MAKSEIRGQLGIRDSWARGCSSAYSATCGLNLTEPFVTIQGRRQYLWRAALVQDSTPRQGDPKTLPVATSRDSSVKRSTC